MSVHQAIKKHQQRKKSMNIPHKEKGSEERSREDRRDSSKGGTPHKGKERRSSEKGASNDRRK